MRRCLLFLALIVFLPALSGASNEFKVNNPDIKKYEFARSYINALAYLKNIDDRWHKKSPKKLYGKDDMKVIASSIDYLTLDNGDWRILKSYMIPYYTAQNALIRKVADDVTAACDAAIAVNDQEKRLWQEWQLLKSKQLGTPKNERIFVKSQQRISVKRKEVAKEIISASVLVTKVLISDKNKDEKGKLLSLTRQQREKLIKKLDVYGKGVLDWGLKPGQTTLTASIAVIREVLEDSAWISLDEK